MNRDKQIDPVGTILGLRNVAGAAADELKEAIDKALELWESLDKLADDYEYIHEQAAKSGRFPAYNHTRTGK